MSIEKDVFKRCSFDYNKLLEYGFVIEKDKFIYNKLFHNDEYKAIITISNNVVDGKVIEMAFNEEYNNIRVKDIIGDYVNSIKEEYIDILKDIRNNCCYKNYFVYDQSNRIAKYLEDTYNVIPEFLWDDEENAALRHNDTKKWFGIIMYVGKDKVDNGKNKDKVEVINVKLEEDIIKRLLHKEGYYPAYHMNKRSWISIILDDSLSDEEVITYIDRSYELTKDSRVWVIPANPKIYNIEKYIKGKKKIYWPRHKSILLNDIVYIYYTKPYGALLFKGEITNFNNNYMEISILDRYSKEEYPLELLKKWGLTSVRSTRRIPNSVINHLDNK